MDMVVYDYICVNEHLFFIDYQHSFLMPDKELHVDDVKISKAMEDLIAVAKNAIFGGVGVSGKMLDTTDGYQMITKGELPEWSLKPVLFVEKKRKFAPLLESPRSSFGRLVKAKLAKQSA